MGKFFNYPPKVFICPSGMFTGVYKKLLAEDPAYWKGAYGDAGRMLQLAGIARQRLRLEYHGVPFSLCIEAELMGAAVDRQAAGEPGITAQAFSDLEEFLACQSGGKINPAGLPAAPDSAVIAPVIEVIRQLKSAEPQVPVVGSLTGPVTMLSWLVDSATLFKSMQNNPDLAHRALEELTPRIIGFGRQQIQAGADMLVLGEPSANGRILGPRHFAQFCSPYLRRIVQDLGADRIILHICGSIQGILPEINKLPVSILSVEAKADLAGIKPALPRKTILRSVCGNG